MQGWTPAHRGVDCMKTKGTRGHGTDIHLLQGLLCRVLKCINLPYIIGSIRAPNGAACGAQQAVYTRGIETGCYLSPVRLPSSLFKSLWRETASLNLSGFCLHFFLILYNTMVIGTSGRVCIWCNNPPIQTHSSSSSTHPHPVESSLKDLLLMS